MAILGRESAYQKQKYVSPSGLQVVEFTVQNLLSSLLYEHGCKCLHSVKIVPLKWLECFQTNVQIFYFSTDNRYLQSSFIYT